MLMPAGGHTEKNETPEEAALREVMEETGLEINFYKQENIWVNYSHAKSLYRPYLILLENIEKPQVHQHVDFIYLAFPKDNKEPLSPFKYYTLDEVETFYNKGMVFEDTLLVLKKVFSENLHLEPAKI